MTRRVDDDELVCLGEWRNVSTGQPAKWRLPIEAAPLAMSAADGANPIGGVPLAERLAYVCELEPFQFEDYAGDTRDTDAIQRHHAKRDEARAAWAERVQSAAVEMLHDETVGASGEEFAAAVKRLAAADGVTAGKQQRAAARVLRDAKKKNGNEKESTVAKMSNAHGTDLLSLSFQEHVTHVQRADRCSRERAYEIVLRVRSLAGGEALHLTSGGPPPITTNRVAHAEPTREEIAALYEKWYPPPVIEALKGQYLVAKEYAVSKILAGKLAYLSTVDESFKTAVKHAYPHALETTQLGLSHGDESNLLALSFVDHVSAIQRRDKVTRERAFEIAHRQRSQRAPATGQPIVSGIPRECGEIRGLTDRR